MEKCQVNAKGFIAIKRWENVKMQKCPVSKPGNDKKLKYQKQGPREKCLAKACKAHSSLRRINDNVIFFKGVILFFIFR